jgi:Tfp pilus assembly PilM family ATPase
MHVIEFQGSFCHVFAWQSGKGSHVLKTLLTIPLEKTEGEASTPDKPSASALKNGAAIRQALKSANLKIKDAVAIIPKQWVTLRIVTLPSTDAAEVSEMARFEAERHIPFNVERHVISHHVLRLEGIEGAQVVIAAIDGPPAWEITATMDAAGIHLTGLEVSTLALFNALMHSGAWNTDEHPTAAQVHIGLSATDITILQKGAPVFARSIALGAEKLFASVSPDGVAGNSLEMLDRIEHLDVFSAPGAAPEARSAETEEGSAFQTPETPENGTKPALQTQNWVNRLVQEIRKTHEFANREFECEPTSRIFCSGVGFCLRGLKEVLHDHLRVPLTEVDPCVKGLRIEKGPSLHLPPFAYATAAGVVAASVHDDSVRVSLLPPDYVRSHDTSQRKRSLLVTGSLALALVVCAVVYAHQLIATKERQLEAIREQVQKDEKLERQIRDRKSQVRILKEQERPEGSALAILNDMSSWKDLFEPSAMRVAITGFNYLSDRGVLKLTGSAASYEEMNNLMVRLKGTKHFNKVVVENWGRDTNNWYPGGLQPIKFTLNCYLGRPEKDSKKKSEPKRDEPKQDEGKSDEGKQD